MPFNETYQVDTVKHTSIDTVVVYSHCLEGFNCPNHPHGVKDSIVYLHANVTTGFAYTKVSPSEVDISVNCTNLYKDVFGNIFYLESRPKQIENVMDSPKLTSFDTIKVGDKVFPAATPFVPRYFAHSKPVQPIISNNTEMMFDVSCFTILVIATIGYAFRTATNNAWTKLWKDIVSA
jgi:hypothetical protein